MNRRKLATAEDLPALRAALVEADRVAVDTEFHPERRYLPQLLLVQLHLKGGSWVLDPLEEGLLEGITEPLLALPWVVHSGAHDLQLLYQALGGLPEVVHDTQIAAGLLRADYPAGYATLAKEVLRVKVDKHATLSDWSQRPLSEAQLDYAVRDVQLLFPLWDALSARLRSRGREEIAHAACREARDLVVEPPADDLLWRSFPGLRHLSRQQAAVAQELLAWREERGRGQDQPARSVLSDGLVLDLARRQPSSIKGILENRRFPRAVVRNHGEELLERIGRAAARPEWGWPQFVRAGSEDALVMSWLRVFGGALAHQNKFSARLVTPRERLMDILMAIRGGEAIEEAVRSVLGPWRSELAAAALVAALEGRRILWLHDLQIILERH